MKKKTAKKVENKKKQIKAKVSASTEKESAGDKDTGERDFKTDKDSLFEQIEMYSSDIEDLEFDSFDQEDPEDEDEINEREEKEEEIERKKSEANYLREELIQVFEDEKESLELKIEKLRNEITE